jgi:capsular exopolysaccharide synthesis family protein
LTLEQNLERQQRARNASPADDSGADTLARIGSYGSDPDYFRAKQQVVLLKAQQQELAQYLRPKHPKMVALAEDIAQRERVLSLFRQETLDQLAGRKNSLAKQLQNLESDVQEWEAKALEISKKTAEFQRIKSAAQRVQALYDRLLATMQTLDVNKDLSPESVVSIEKASRAVPDQPHLLKALLVGGLIGFALGLALLLFVDHLDDRINGLTELTAMFDESVVGQIPRVKAGRKGELAMVRPEDDRHAFVEAYRNLRSSLLFMSPGAQRPRSILVTSSIPNDGKSLTAANLAASLAAAGSRVLLVDGDLRKGILHTRFALQPQPGLYEVLAEGADLAQAVRPTSEANLFLLPRGRTTGKSSELFLGQSTRQFLVQATSQYDFVIFDTAPVMAADDVTSLAPYLDGVLFVIRARHTSARVARASLDLLARRNVRLLGLVFNAVTSGSGDYYYYRYKDYYKTYPTA